jgi:hypothetical protein
MKDAQMKEKEKELYVQRLNRGGGKVGNKSMYKSNPLVLKGNTFEIKGNAFGEGK